MSDHTENPDQEPVVNIDSARSRLARHRKKIKLAALAAAGATLFVLGRKSTNVDVEVDYNPDSESDSNQD